MPQEILRLRLFVSAPRDLDSEIQLIRDIVAEMNKNWSSSSGVEIEVISWKDDVVLDVGLRVQAVINDQLADYDIYLGIMGHRFGQPTGVAGSGTEEEFDCAFDRFGDDPTSVRIMFYFKNTPISPFEVDPDELLKVKAFKTRISDQGVLYGSFADSDEFAYLLRLHLSRVAQSWQRDTAISASVSAEPDSEAPEQAEDDRGLLDLLGERDERSAEFAELMTRMSDATSELGTRIRERTDQLSGSGGLATPAQRRHTQEIIARTVADVNHFTERMKGEVPLFAETYSSWIEVNIQLLRVLQDFNQPGEDELAGTRKQVAKLLANLSEANTSMVNLREAMAGWPRISAGLNRAKRKALATLDELAAEMDSALNITGELMEGLKELE